MSERVLHFEESIVSPNLHIPLPSAPDGWHPKTVELLENRWGEIDPARQVQLHVLTKLGELSPNCAAIESLARRITLGTIKNPGQVSDLVNQHEGRLYPANPQVTQNHYLDVAMATLDELSSLPDGGVKAAVAKFTEEVAAKLPRVLSLKPKNTDVQIPKPQGIEKPTAPVRLGPIRSPNEQRERDGRRQVREIGRSERGKPARGWRDPKPKYED